MARAWTGTQRKKLTTSFAMRPMPPELDRMNRESAELSYEAIALYRNGQGLSREEALVSLLVGLKHLCDFDTRFGDFDEKLALALHIYEENTRASNDGQLS